jgi:transposase, IS5 family
MRRDKYAPDKVFMTLQTLASEMDAERVALDGVLDDDARVQRVKAAMRQRHGRTLLRGRPSSPVEGVLRMRVVKAL